MSFDGRYDVLPSLCNGESKSMSNYLSEKKRVIIGSYFSHDNNVWYVFPLFRLIYTKKKLFYHQHRSEKLSDKYMTSEQTHTQKKKKSEQPVLQHKSKVSETRLHQISITKCVCSTMAT